MKKKSGKDQLQVVQKTPAGATIPIPSKEEFCSSVR
jgi:hypothetical protein